MLDYGKKKSGFPQEEAEPTGYVPGFDGGTDASAARLRVLQDFFYSCGQRYGGRERVFMRGFAGAKTTGRDRLTEKPTAKSAEKRISWRKKEI